MGPITYAIYHGTLLKAYVRAWHKASADAWATYWHGDDAIVQASTGGYGPVIDQPGEPNLTPDVDDEEEDDEQEEAEPRKHKPEWAVCPKCEGNGTHPHDALNVWTSDMIAEDPDSFEEYMRGTYDVPCTRCNGLRVIDVSKEAQEDWAEREQDRRTRLMEQGIWPGSEY
jgi:hypothetical protein